MLPDAIRYLRGERSDHYDDLRWWRYHLTECRHQL